jgi:hypothetical protein
LLLAFSLALPLLTLLVLVIRGKVKRERVVVAVARGMRAMALPMAATLAVLFAGLTVWTAGLEKGNLSRMREVAARGEAQYYAGQAGQTWPVVQK